MPALGQLWPSEHDDDDDTGLNDNHLDTKLEAERKMTRIVVGFLRNFFSEQSTARAAVLRREPRIAIVEQMVPPIVKWLSGIMPSCERKVVERNRIGPLTSCAFTETVKEWGSHRPRSICSYFLSVCTIKDPQTNVYLSPQPRANKQIEVEKHIKHTGGRGLS